MKTRIRKSEETPATPTTRLTGMEVSEVSIVDRAANQRKFLVVKDAAPAAPPAAPAVPPAPAAQPPAAPTAMQISPEAKAKIASVLKAAQEKIAEITKALDGSAETPGAALPQELKDQLIALAGLFGTPAAPAAPAAPHAPPHAAPPAMKDDTAKAGKKISSARLAQLMNAKTAIDSILAEVDPQEDETGTEPSGEPAPTEKNDSAPAATAAVNDVAEIKASIAGLGQLVESMAKLFEGQNQRIDQLAKSRGESRQLVDLDPPAVKKAAGGPVAWPMDMARPAKTVD